MTPFHHLSGDSHLHPSLGAGGPLRHLIRNLSAAETSPRSFASRAAVMASRWASGYAAWREHRRALRELAALDDRMLRDIGISRSEIESVAYGRDPTRLRDATVAASRRQRWPAAGAGMRANPQQSAKDSIKKKRAA